MSSPSFKIKDEQILPLVLAGYSQRQIAEMLNATPTTISKRIKRKEFADQLSAYRKGILDNTITRLTSLSSRAVDVLAELLESENDFVRFNSASKILSMAQDYSLQTDLLKQIEELRERQNELMENQSASVTMDYD